MKKLIVVLAAIALITIFIVGSAWTTAALAVVIGVILYDLSNRDDDEDNPRSLNIGRNKTWHSV